MLATTKHAFDWWNERVTNEIYLSTHRADWWRFCHIAAELLAPHENVLDVGTGDGHTIWQVISNASALRTFRTKYLTLVEPNESGLRRAVRRCQELPLAKVAAYHGRFEQFAHNWELERRPKFDALFAGHVNYYLGASGGTGREAAYFAALDAMPRLAHTVIIVTAPRDGDYYKMVRNPFGEYVYDDMAAAHYSSRGFSVETIGTTMRFYVEHVNQSRHEATVLWKFFNNTERQPSDQELGAFIANANRIKDADGNLNFRDQILVVTAK